MATEPPSDADPSTADPADAGYCWKCGYDLRGLDDQQCPECGFRFDVEAVRDMNLQWSVLRLQGIRDATLIQSMACSVLAVSVVTRAWSSWLVLFLMTAGAVIAVFVGVRALQCYFFGSPSRTWDVAWRISGGATKAVLFGLAVLFLVLLTSKHWFLYRLVLLLAGMLLAGIELQQFTDGRRRNKTYAIPDDLVRSLNLSHGVNVVLLAASAVGVLLLIAFGR